MWVAKVAAARLRRANLPDGDDFVTRVFGSKDFRRTVAAFGSRDAKKPPEWTGD